jgi:preprotein translocase subunit SecG
MPSYLLIAQILVAIALIAVVLLQVRGGGLGGIFGQADSVYRTRRGMEKNLLQFTIALVVLFIILSVWIVRLAS